MKIDTNDLIEIIKILKANIQEAFPEGIEMKKFDNKVYRNDM